MAKKDLEELFAQVRPGDEVEIHGERNETVAAIFSAELPVTVVQAQAIAPMVAGQ
jgi:hypothetical protein